MDKKKLEKMFSDVRKKAVEVEQALSESAKRERAEAHRPHLSSSDKYESAINSDKLMVRAALAIKAYDYSQRYGQGIDLLTTEQQTRLVRSLQSEEAQAVLRQIYDIYEGAKDYGRYLIALRSQWQKVVGGMAELLTRWTAADDIAKGLTSTLKGILEKYEGSETQEDGKLDLLNPLPPTKETLIKFLKMNFEEAVAESPYKVYFNFNEDTQEFEADIDTGGLYSAILKAQKGAEYQLQMLKGAVEPFSDFLYSEVTFANGEKNLPLWFIPEVVEGIVEYPDAVEFDGNPNNKKYFQYQLLRRKEKGETITPADEKRAVIPDYNQTTESSRSRHSAEVKLINIFKDLYQVDGKEED